MRSHEERIQRLVCGEHCRFFKPWRREDRPCGGHQWLLRRAQVAESTFDELEKLRGAPPPQPLRADALILRTVCSECSYQPDGCRYRAGVAGAVPCGGAIAIDLLHSRGVLCVEELYRPLRRAEATSA